MDNQTIDRATLCNLALAELGQPASFTIDTETELGGTVDRAFFRVRDRCFALHDWSFCRRTKKLARQAAAPANGWRHGFDLPGDRIGPPLKLLRDIGPPAVLLRDYDIESSTVFAQVPDVWARCKVAVDPAAWDPGFVDAFVVALAAALAVPLQQDLAMRDALNKDAFGTPSEAMTGGRFGRLIAQDRAGQPLGSPMHVDDPLTSARWS